MLESALRYDVCVRQEGLVKKLFTWAREAERPLNIYATGLLARAMSNQEVAASYGEENAQLVGPRSCRSLHYLTFYTLHFKPS